MKTVKAVSTREEARRDVIFRLIVHRDEPAADATEAYCLLGRLSALGTSTVGRKM